MTNPTLTIAQRIAAKKAAQAQQEAQSPIKDFTDTMIGVRQAESPNASQETLRASGFSLTATNPSELMAKADVSASGTAKFLIQQKGIDEALEYIRERLGACETDRTRSYWAEVLEAATPERQPSAPAPKAKRSLKEILEEKKKAAQGQALGSAPALNLASAVIDTQADQGQHLETFSLKVDFNEKQIEASNMALAGQTFCLIGAAGSGKTTCQRQVAKTLLESNKLSSCTFKIQGSGVKVTAPSIAFVAYTRRASGNLERAIHKDPELKEAFANNVMTIHALLEFQPVFFFDEEKQCETMRFLPNRTAANPLTITHLVIEEASMVGLDLWDFLYDALPEGVQIILIGDINQLPPVFGPSILNYGLAYLPVVELTKIYRQAEGSAILDNAHAVRKGAEDELVFDRPEFQLVEGKAPVEVGAPKMSAALSGMFKALWKSGQYDPEQDIILSPFNVGELGTDTFNRYVAQFLGEARNALVHEVIAGFEKHYLAEGDRVLYKRRDAIITKITRNGQYMGKAPGPASNTLNRFGFRDIGEGDFEDVLSGYENFSLDDAEQEARKQQASHIITVKVLDSNSEETIDSAGDLNGQNFQLGYSLTIHKAQGCEWRHVFLVLHKTHASMTYRELLYTAITRAKERFVLLGKKHRLLKAMHNPRIKGNNLQDKIAYFNANMDLTRQVKLSK